MNGQLSRLLHVACLSPQQQASNIFKARISLLFSSHALNVAPE